MSENFKIFIVAFQPTHKESDTPDKLDYEKMAKVVEGFFEVVQK